jgi:MFS family permease
MDAVNTPTQGWDAIAPLRERTFRTVWSASLFSNFGQLILGVGAAWEMTRLTASPDMVALVQTAMMVPLMLVSVPAGAIADMFDRRRIALTGLAFATLSAATLTALVAAGFGTPWVLLLFCMLIGAGVALYGPAWQASVGEQVSADHLPAAVALTSISYNLARSFGPAVGGVIVLTVGAVGAFAVNAIGYIPLIIAFMLWRRDVAPSRLPPERLDRAIISGARYAIHSPPVRTVIIRSLLFGFATATTTALTPLVARDLLGGDAGTYGLLLGATGVGAVMGALLSSRLRESMGSEQAARICAIAVALAIAGIGFSTDLILSCLLFLIVGVGNMLTITLFNVGVQLAVPRWVTARALAWFVSAMTGGIALGAWIWGAFAGEWGLSAAFYASGAAVALTLVVGLVLPLPRLSVTEIQMVELAHEPEVALAITNRSGPIIIEIDYRVDADNARQFYNLMLEVQRVRQRNGAFDWSLSRDIGDPMLWTERCHFPTWGDYLRHRERFTETDRAVQAAADALNVGPGRESRVRRRLERPFGSVRWRADTPDLNRGPLDLFTP